MDLRRALVVLGLALLSAVPAEAGVKLEPWRGHVSFGYARLFSDEFSPGGSISLSGGVDYPVNEHLRIGPVLGIALLGTHDVVRGSIAAGLDYSMLDVALQAHWAPAAGPITRVSLGPGFAVARTSLQVGGGGAGFLDLAVDEVKPEFALDVTSIPRRMKVVGIGVEGGVRFVPVDRVNWILGSLKMTIHY